MILWIQGFQPCLLMNLWNLDCQLFFLMTWLSPDLLQSPTIQIGHLGLLPSQTIEIDSQAFQEPFTHYLFIFIHQSGKVWWHWNPTYNMMPFHLALSHISGSSVMTYSPFSSTTRLTWWCSHPWPSTTLFCWRHFITSDILSDFLSSLAITSRVSWPFSWASSSCSSFPTASFAQDHTHHKSSFMISSQLHCVFSSSPWD